MILLERHHGGFAAGNFAAEPFAVERFASIDWLVYICSARAQLSWGPSMGWPDP